MSGTEAQFRSLSLMRDGWHDEDPSSKAPTAQVIEATRAALPSLVAIRGFGRPHMRAMRYGGVSVEWRVGTWVVVVRVDTTGGASALASNSDGRCISMDTMPLQVEMLAAMLRHVVSSA